MIEPFDEEPPNLEIFTPDIHCDTGKIYRIFRECFIDDIDPNAAKEWLTRPTIELMQLLDPLEANDLYKPALLACNNLRDHQKPDRFFSGSGSSFFRLAL